MNFNLPPRIIKSIKNELASLLVLDSNIYHIEGDTLILDIDGGEYDENTETMTLI